MKLVNLKSHKKTGIAGEYATYAELHRIGLDPNLADPNEPVFDLLARIPGDFNKTGYRQVKTRGMTSQAGSGTDWPRCTMRPAGASSTA